MFNKLKAGVIASLVYAACIIPAMALDFTFYAINSSPAGYTQNEQQQGYYVEILHRVAKRLDLVDPKVVIAPYPRIVNALIRNQDGVVVTCLFPNESFTENIYQPRKVASFQTSIVSLPDAPINWDNLAGKKIGTLRGASKVYGEIFHQAVEDEQLKLVAMSSYSQALKMLEAKRIDGFAGSLGVILSLADQQQLALAAPANITKRDSMITISVSPSVKNGNEVVAQVDEIIQQMIASGEIQDIVERYLPDEIQQR
ncbi:ABC transporter substrate-binding protein [Agarivorans sp. 1_MG-2023]|uniref:substrate-binding periplasmic protein n=1 Tax=Agarivorans sp. 1_MG-2023 TaxID=3062634 RepID=UPI0026E1F0A1|nr:transporter substrate-binding domain-containing protein [Agarivorans sp. 1_MG-2023]MDO6762851.1 transporter substrate-binding domain-containing protein [Agarivorans sp. 1_MG-2023]